MTTENKNITIDVNEINDKMDKGLNLEKTINELKKHAGSIATIVLVIAYIQLVLYIFLIAGNSDICNYHYVAQVVDITTTPLTIHEVTRYCFANSYRGGFGIWATSIDLVVFLGVVLYIYGLGKNIEDPLGEYISVVLMLCSGAIIIKNLVYFSLIVWSFMVTGTLHCPCILLGGVMLFVISIGYVIYIIYLVLMSKLLTKTMNVLQIKDAYDPKKYKQFTNVKLIESHLLNKGINVKKVLSEVSKNTTAYERLNNNFMSRQKKMYGIVENGDDSNITPNSKKKNNNNNYFE